MKQSISFLFIAILSCKTPKESKLLKYAIYDSTGHKSNIEMYIPKDYKSKAYIENWEGLPEKRFWYADSGVLYICDDKGGSWLNYNNIVSQQGALSKKIIYDTLTLQGIDKDGKYWKEIKLDRISLGYSRIPKERKDEFDKAVDNWKVK